MKVTIATSAGPQELAKSKFMPKSPVNFPHPLSMMASPHIRGFILKDFDYRKLHRTVRRQRMVKKIKKWKRNVFLARHTLLSVRDSTGLQPPPKLQPNLPTEPSTKDKETVSTASKVETVADDTLEKATWVELPSNDERSAPTPISPTSKPSRKRRAECLLISPIHSSKKTARGQLKIDQMVLSARQILDDGDANDQVEIASKSTSSSCDLLVSPIAKKRRFF